MSKKLRFASLIRVSTEGQQKKGESLKTQRKQIEQAMEILGGVICEAGAPKKMNYYRFNTQRPVGLGDWLNSSPEKAGREI